MAKTSKGMPDVLDIYHVPDDASDGPEFMGAKRKFWFTLLDEQRLKRLSSLDPGYQVEAYVKILRRPSERIRRLRFSPRRCWVFGASVSAVVGSHRMVSDVFCCRKCCRPAAW